MRGIVRLTSKANGFIAIITDDSEYTVAEILGGYDIDVGDEISGDLETLGGTTFLNLTKSEEMDVYVQDIHASKKRALDLLDML